MASSCLSSANCTLYFAYTQCKFPFHNTHTAQHMHFTKDTLHYPHTTQCTIHNANQAQCIRGTEHIPDVTHNTMQCEAAECIDWCSGTCFLCASLDLCTAGTALRSITLHCTALHRTALHCNAMQCNAMQCNAMQCNAIPCTAIRCNSRVRK